MKEEPVRTLEDLYLTVQDDTRKLIQGTVDGARHSFNHRGEVLPAIITLDDDGQPAVFEAIHRNSVEKQIIWTFLRFIREIRPIVLLVSEAWVSMLQGKKVDLDNLTPPSQDPNHVEEAMINVWELQRTILISARITRHPDKLGEFIVKLDTLNPDEKVEGQLSKGEGYQPIYKRKDRYER